GTNDGNDRPARPRSRDRSGRGSRSGRRTAGSHVGSRRAGASRRLRPLPACRPMPQRSLSLHLCPFGSATCPTVPSRSRSSTRLSWKNQAPVRSIATSNAHYTLSSVGPCRPFVTSVTPTWSKHTVVSAALAGLFLAGAVTVDTSDLATAG